MTPDQNVEDSGDMSIDKSLLRGIYSYGFVTPSTVQKKGIKPIIDGRHTLLQASSGTGKTCVFIIGALQQIDPYRRVCQALILAPGRELVNQIHQIVLALSDNLHIRSHACIGGTSVRDDIDKLRDGTQLVVGTAGRVFDMISKRHLRVWDIRMFVIDEADELLSRSFASQVYDIWTSLTACTQVCLCSTTLSPGVVKSVAEFMPNPARIPVHDHNLMLPHVRQFHVAVEKEEWKLDTLCDLYETLTLTQAIVFFRSRRTVDFIADQLSSRGFTVSVLHAELDQKERDLVMREFGCGSSRILLASDTLSRGIDVQGVSVVINADLPQTPERYLHQIGRAGRFGRKGVAISFVTDADVPLLRSIESRYRAQIQSMPMDVAELI